VRWSEKYLVIFAWQQNQEEVEMPAITVHAYEGETSSRFIFPEIFALGNVGSDPVYVRAGTADDYIVSSSGGDVLYGDSGGDVIVSGDGNDVIFGDRSWDDTAVFVYNPTFYVSIVSWIDDVILSGAGNDVIFTGGGDNKVNAGSGDDYILGLRDNDTIFGGFGSDTIYGGQGDDVLYGGTPETLDLLAYDRITVTSNGVTPTPMPYTSISAAVTGLGESAFLDTGNDWIDGGDGNDLIVGQAGNDTLIGGAGDDTIDGGSDIDTIDGGAGRDIIGGGDGNDSISGGDGNDYLDGAAGNDYILAGDGEDLVFGGLGNDVVYGGTGSDVFLFRAGDGADIIMDFVAGSQADVITLQNAGFGTFADVQAHMSFYAAGNATYIQIGSDQIFLANVLPSQLDASDFAFL
jgi:Ca2+-binding RTX toxin-like protein